MRGTLIAAALTLAACSSGSTPTATPTPTATLPGAPTAQAEYWEVSLEAPASFRPGEPAAARVRIAARGGYHVNLDYPAAFVPSPDATADFPSARVRLESPEKTACADHAADTCALAAAVPFTPRPGAELRVAGTLAFSVCTAERCLVEKAPLAVTASAPR